MTVQDKIQKEADKNFRLKIRWTNSLLDNHLKKDINKASRYKTQFEIHHLHSPKKAKAKAFIKFCHNNIDSSKVLWRLNKNNLVVIVKDPSV